MTTAAGTASSMEAVLALVRAERLSQELRYGDTNDLLLDGTGPTVQWLGMLSPRPATSVEQALRFDYEAHQAEHGLPTWMHLVREEIAEAFQESDPEKLADEIIQVAALCVSWVERIRARRKGAWD